MSFNKFLLLLRLYQILGARDTTVNQTDSLGTCFHGAYSGEWY